MPPLPKVPYETIKSMDKHLLERYVEADLLNRDDLDSKKIRQMLDLDIGHCVSIKNRITFTRPITSLPVIINWYFTGILGGTDDEIA